MPINEVLLLHHCHTDVGYTHPQPVFWELQRRFIDQAIDQCEQTADWPEPSRLRWTCECTAPLIHWLDRASPRQIERLRRLVQAGQIGAAALPFHPTPLCSYDELSRSLAPVARLRDELGLPLRVAIGHDINGLPWPVTQALLDAGVEMLIMGINQVFGRYPLERPMAFRWRGSDQRDVLAFNGEHYGTFHREFPVHGGDLDAVADALDAYISRRLPNEYPHPFIYLTATHSYFVDNNPPDMEIARLVRRWNDEQRQPRIRYILPEDLLEAVGRDASRLPVHGGDWTDYWNFGCASAATPLRIHRSNQARLRTAELLAATTGPARPDSLERLDEAASHVSLFGEHTWCASPSVSHPDNDRTLEQSNHKAHLVWHARGLLSVAMRDQLESLAANPTEGVGAQGVLLVNSAATERSVVLRLPRSWLTSKESDSPLADEAGRLDRKTVASWRHFLSTTYRIDTANEALDDFDSEWIGPIELPAWGWRRVPVAELNPARVGHGSSIKGHELESPHFRLSFCRESGRVQSLIERRSGREMVDAESPWSLFGYVQETLRDQAETDTPYRGREAMFDFDFARIRANISGWKPDWPAQRRTPTRLVEATTFTEGDAVCLRLRFDAPGVASLRQCFRLPAHRPVVELETSFDKLDIKTPESIYFTFPLGIADWRAHYDTADLPVALDEQQLPGSCRDWLTVGRWVCVHDDGLAVTLACPDAPMVQVGGFNFGRAQRSVDRSQRCLLLAWPCSNYWMTNFPASQPGPIRLRWELSASKGYDPLVSTRAGWEAACPVEAQPVLTCPRATEGRLVSIDAQTTVLLAARPGGAASERLVTVANPAEQDDHVRLSLPDHTIERAAVVNPLGREGHVWTVRDHAVVGTVGARSFCTVQLQVRT